MTTVNFIKLIKNIKTLIIGVYGAHFLHQYFTLTKKFKNLLPSVVTYFYKITTL